jgi:nucleoside-diphosphate-sugar epimerase
LPKEVRLETGSIADPSLVARAAQGCDVLFQTAGITALGAPKRVLRWVHVAGTENVLRAARYARVRRLVHLSCSDVSLCNEDRMHWDEARVLAQPPLGDFARSKLMSEEIALAASDRELEVTALRPALLWGPGNVEGLAGLAREARRGGARIFDGGRNILPLTHIDNLIQACLSAMTATEAPSRAYYITDGEFIDAREALPKLLSAAGLPTKLRDSSLTAALVYAGLQTKLGLGGRGAEEEILRRGRSALFDLSRARKDLDYAPRVELASGVEGLRAWIERQGGIDKVIARARPLATAADVDAQVAAAGGD